MEAAGGLHRLACTPSYIIRVLGAQIPVSADFGHIYNDGCEAYLYHSEIVQQTQYGYRRQAQHKVANRIAVLAHIDWRGESTDGLLGREMREKIEKMLENLQNPPDPRGSRNLPSPAEPRN